MIRRPPRSTQSRSSAASDVYKRQVEQEPTQQSPHQRPQSRISPPPRRHPSSEAGVGTRAVVQRTDMELENDNYSEGTQRLPPRGRTSPPPRTPRTAEAGAGYGAEEPELHQLPKGTQRSPPMTLPLPRPRSPGRQAGALVKAVVIRWLAWRRTVNFSS